MPIGIAKTAPLWDYPPNRRGVMKKRSVVEFIILVCVTLGIYWLVYLYKAKEEMKALGADIPTFFLFFIPGANVWWMWKWACGVEVATKKAVSAGMAFALIFFLQALGGAFLIARINPTAVVETPPAA